MKIGFLTSEFPLSKFGASGGIGTSIYGICKGLLASGYTPIVLIYNQPNDEVLEMEGITFYCIKNIKVKGLSWWLTQKKIEKKINELYDKGIINLIEAPDWTGITSFIQPKKCPIVIRLNGSDTYFCYLDNRPVKFWNKFHEKRALKKANGHISVSQFTAEVTNQLFGLQIPFTIIPNGIDITDFQNNTNANSKNKTILYFGTLIRKKGLLELPHIFNQVQERYPKAELILVGRDASDKISGNSSTWKMMEPFFSSKAKERAQYVGGVSYKEVKDFITQATVCVFPSFAEALPVSWLEAMAMKKAIVASNIGWATEVIKDGEEGFLVNPKDHKTYADKIITLLSDEKINKNCGELAFQKIQKKFESNKLINQNLNFYQQIITKKG